MCFEQSYSRDFSSLVSLVEVRESFALEVLVLPVLIFFVELACHLPELNGFDQHFQATVLFPTTRAVDYPQQH